MTAYYAGNGYSGTSTTTDGTWGLSTNGTNIIHLYVDEPRPFFEFPTFDPNDWRRLWWHLDRTPIVPVEDGSPSRHGPPPIARDLTHQALKSRPQMARAPPSA